MIAKYLIFVQNCFMDVLEYEFRATLWRDSNPSGWYFLSLPKSLSKKIRAAHKKSEEGWGRLKTKATIGETDWDTAIWYDTKFETYLMPVKGLIRKKESLTDGSRVKVLLSFDLERLILDGI
jgi:hypothetical protein